MIYLHAHTIHKSTLLQKTRTGRLVHTGGKKLRNKKEHLSRRFNKKKKKCYDDEVRGKLCTSPLRVCIVCLFAVFLEHIFSYNGVQEKKKSNHCRE